MAFPLYSFMKIFCVWKMWFIRKRKWKVLLSCPHWLFATPWVSRNLSMNSKGKNTGGLSFFLQGLLPNGDRTQISHIAQNNSFLSEPLTELQFTNLSLDGFVSCSFVIYSSWQCVCVSLLLPFGALII